MDTWHVDVHYPLGSVRILLLLRIPNYAWNNPNTFQHHWTPHENC
ncbi:hypothetical protein EG68_12515, partial [Paragonimus skrjabini miyazakii]